MNSGVNAGGLSDCRVFEKSKSLALAYGLPIIYTLPLRRQEGISACDEQAFLCYYFIRAGTIVLLSIIHFGKSYLYFPSWHSLKRHATILLILPYLPYHSYLLANKKIRFAFPTSHQNHTLSAFFIKYSWRSTLPFIHSFIHSQEASAGRCQEKFPPPPQPPD